MDRKRNWRINREIKHFARTVVGWEQTRSLILPICWLRFYFFISTIFRSFGSLHTDCFLLLFVSRHRRWCSDAGAVQQKKLMFHVSCCTITFRSIHLYQAQPILACLYSYSFFYPFVLQCKSVVVVVVLVFSHVCVWSFSFCVCFFLRRSLFFVLLLFLGIGNIRFVVYLTTKVVGLRACTSNKWERISLLWYHLCVGIRCFGSVRFDFISVSIARWDEYVFVLDALCAGCGLKPQHIQCKCVCVCAFVQDDIQTMCISYLLVRFACWLQTA